MTTLWGIITGNSTLPVSSGNSFWDHLNNQEITQTNVGAQGGVTANIQVSVLEANIINVLSVETQDNLNQAQVADNALSATPGEINVDSVYNGADLGVNI